MIPVTLPRSLAALALALVCAAPPRAGAETWTVPEVVTRIEKRLQAVTEYDVVMEAEIQGKKNRTQGTYHLWRRRPDRFRLRVEKGDHRGSEIALSDGGVRARPGGFLKKLVATSMSRDDPRLRSPRGAYPWDACLERQHQLLNERLRMSQDAHLRPTGEHRLVLELTYRDPAQGTAMREVWTLDTQEWLLVAQDIFEDGKQVERVRYRDFHPNPGLKDADLAL
jgi:outer membrane lipoprotein-sorting protein